MDGLREPVGDLPREVYVRRRIVAAIGALLVVVVLYFLISSPGGGGDDPAGASGTTSPTPQVSDDPTVSPDPALDASRACTAADVQLTVTPNPRDFGAGALPKFDVLINTVGATPCKLDTTAEGTSLLITSGSDRIFSSTDCTPDATINDRQFVLQPGAQETFQVTWNRQRSVEGCTTIDALPRPGTYHAQLTVQGIAANDASFTLSE